MGSHDTIFAVWLAAYDEAFNAKDLDKLATFYDPEVTIFEGGGINHGWADYRDHHLGPELGAFEDLKFGHTDVRAFPLSAESAYVTAESISRRATRNVTSTLRDWQHSSSSRRRVNGKSAIRTRRAGGLPLASNPSPLPISMG